MVREKRYKLKRKLDKEVCTECGTGTEWNGKPLVLPIDHIDGDRFNNEPSNLRYLCPNCHSQTPTFAGRNSKKPTMLRSCACGAKFIDKVDGKRIYCSQSCSMSYNRNLYVAPPKIDWPDVAVLLSMVSEHGYVGTGKILGVSDVSVHKRLRKYGGK